MTPKLTRIIQVIVVTAAVAATLNGLEAKAITKDGNCYTGPDNGVGNWGTLIHGGPCKTGELMKKEVKGKAIREGGTSSPQKLPIGDQSWPDGGKRKK